MLTTAFMHIHIPRTGGTTLRSFMGAMPGAQLLDPVPHASYSHMASRAKDLGISVPPAFAFIRKPWDYLVSQWSWLRKIGAIETSFLQYLGIVKEKFEEGYAPDPIHRTLNFGPISWPWRVLEADKAQHIGRFEHFEEDTIHILTALVPSLPEGWIQDTLESVENYRKTSHRPYQSYYTKETAGWVAVWDADLIERFGYTYD